MSRAFSRMKLPLGAYQFAALVSTDLGEQFTDSGKAPRTLLMVLSSPLAEQFKTTEVTLLMSEEAQRHLVAALQSNLEDDAHRALELVKVFHPEYGEYAA